MRTLIRRTSSAAIVALFGMTVVDSASKSPAYSGVEWAAPGGDWGATRYSTLDQINTSNISRLGGAW